NKKLRPTEMNGSLWDIAPPRASPGRLTPAWNHMHVTAQGRRVSVDINGVRVLDEDLDRYENLIGKHPGLLNTTGRVGLQSLSATCDFREIYVRPLTGGK